MSSFDNTDSSEMLPGGDIGRTLVDALGKQDEIGLVFVDNGLRVTHAVAVPARFRELDIMPGTAFTDLIPPADLAATTNRLRSVLDSGVPMVTRTHRVQRAPDGTPVFHVAISALRLEDPHGHPAGLALTFIDRTDETRARRRLDLVLDSVSIGASLDVTATAQQLADALVPEFGDMAGVNLAHEVFRGDEPVLRVHPGELAMVRAALAPQGRDWPAGYLLPGDSLPSLPDETAVRAHQRGATFWLPDRASITRQVHDDPHLVRRLLPEEEPGLSLAVSSLETQGLVLGSVEVWRREGAEPYTEDDMRVLTAIATRAAVNIDNARRYTREHATVLALQRSLLPEAATHTPATEAAGFYLPSSTDDQELGGDWYDVIPLPSLRVALVVGEVVGHGLRATATMGRMRTAVQTLADLDLTPDELLTHLDDLVLRFGGSDPAHEGTLGSTCLYAVYDPVSGHCTVASAGHPAPALVHADGTADFVDLVPGPPLGAGEVSFESAELDLSPGDAIALYTDGLVRNSRGGTETGREAIRRALVAARPTSGNLQAGLTRLADEVLPQELNDDVTLLLARVRAVPDTDVATWVIPADPARVAGARDDAIAQLKEWNLEDLAFTTELVVSELVTNAIRYTHGPAVLRLVRDDHVLICEVSDPSSTQPWLRRAKTTDEGGRGLFMIAQLTKRWGSRYTKDGKTIWTEQVHTD